MSVNLAMKGLIYYNLPRKPLISLSVLRAGMSSMALIFSGSTSILGFTCNLKCFILSKNLYKVAR